jgi:hypothetical protein
VACGASADGGTNNVTAFRRSSLTTGPTRPGDGASGLVRTGATLVTLGAVGLAGGLLALGLALTISSPAFASSVTETFAGKGPTGYVEIQLSMDFVQPASVTQGASYTMTDTGGSQVVPTSNSNIPVNYISGLQDLIPVPSNAAVIATSVPTRLTWSFTSTSGSTTTGPYEVTLCTAAGQTGCTATATSSSFLGTTSLPYLELSTGSATFAAGGTLTLPDVSVQFTATGAGGSTIQPTVSEFDTNANINLFGTVLNIPIQAYPSVTFTGTPTTPPAYQFQPLATTTITGSSSTTTSTPSSTTTSTPSSTTTSTPSSTTTSTPSSTTTSSTTSTTSTTVAGTSSTSGSGPSAGTTSSSGTSSGALAFTGPSPELWLLAVVGFVAIDVGYLLLTAVYRPREILKAVGRARRGQRH